ncbi:hypothetical protein A374_03674 [Fictibacillus macauensis ZFHKF-1]|uniref:Uncharacterized protein n=1 Tax=Fictibacillus macauensis ZFHKF-1 TaxID=1196324 RepID=I8ALW7_9BACL|nr:DUF6143 family protein [Fictibacillus macauensis]EIT86639.1 hypothetical protein A374_03674 [Fictibacillus macauensis ZFHKF-1]
MQEERQRNKRMREPIESVRTERVMKKQEWPIYTADVSDGYKQALAGKYFKGRGQEMPFGNGTKSYALLVNPEQSDVTIILNKIKTANFSNSPVRISTYLCATARGELTRSSDIAPGNYTDCGKKTWRAEIYTGCNLRIIGGKNVMEDALKAFENNINNAKGSVLLPPGTMYIVELSSICPRETGYAVMSFFWWEMLCE